LSSRTRWKWRLRNSWRVLGIKYNDYATIFRKIRIHKGFGCYYS
jgi:hypothetical protein